MEKASKSIGLLGIGALVALAAPAHAGGLTARVGTLGGGLEYGFAISDDTQLRVGANAGTSSTTGDEGGVDYDLRLKLRTADVLIDWHPFGGVFYTSVGAFYNKNKLEAKAKSGTVNIGGTNYANPDLRGEVTFKSFAPYLGAGWGSRPNVKGFAWAVDAGVLYQGSPTVTLSSSSGVSQADLDREAADLQESIKNYKYYPLIGVSFGYRF